MIYSLVKVKNYLLIAIFKNMVLPLTDESNPKCYMCHEGFDNIEKLREHQNQKHADTINQDKVNTKREPAPGDVTVF
jgi:hypothetical protein